ncbi:MAG TPA: FHA domain-containing protein [Anaerolineaceae bacterium]|nr:FHA domain-containing protein [Anaerolineaceae bacterium]
MPGPNYQLTMRSGPNQGQVAPLTKNEIHVGRDLGNDIVINDAEVSRRHARLMLQTGGYIIEDLGSTNGTTVNGQRLIGPYLLRPGDVINLGENIVLEFEAGPVDPDATVATVVNQPPANQAPPPLVPVHSIPATPEFSGRVPTGPAPEVVDAPEEPPQRNKRLIIGLVIGILALVCVCGGLIWGIDSMNLWCRLFPFLAGCPA